MHAGFLDVLHDAGDEDVLAVGKAIDIDFGGVGQIAVDQHRAACRHDEFGRPVEIGGQARHVAVELRGVVDDLHGAAAQHIGRPDHDRIADLVGDGARLLRRWWRCRSSAGAASSLSSSFWKRSRSSARSMASGEVPRIGTPASSSGSASFSGVWPPNCTMTPCSVPLRALGVDDLEHVLGGQRLEIEPVGGVVVGRHGLRVAVDHDGLEAGLVRARRRRGSSNSRTRCPGRCGSGRRRG